MKVVTTNLAIRFYTQYGWTKEILDSLVEKKSKEDGFYNMETGEFGEYWIPVPGTKLDMDKLMEKVTSIDKTFNDYPHLSDKEFLERYNW